MDYSSQITFSLRQQTGDSIPVRLCTDAGKRARGFGIITIKLLPCCLERVNQFILCLTRHEDVIRSRARLDKGPCSGPLMHNMCSKYTCPEFMVLPQRMRLAAKSKSVFESTITGDLPPNSRVTGVRCFAAAVATIRPILPLPGIQMRTIPLVMTTTNRCKELENKLRSDSTKRCHERTVIPFQGQ